MGQAQKQLESIKINKIKNKQTNKQIQATKKQSRIIPRSPQRVKHV